MRVTKRDGTVEEVAFDKISARLRKLANAKLPNALAAVDITRITSTVVASMFDGIPTTKIDELTADACVTFQTEHPDYGDLASRILISNWHKSTSDSVLETYERMSSVLSEPFLDCVRRHATELQAMVDYKRDYAFDYFGVKTLEKIYCSTVGGVLIERPQHVYMRVAIALHGDDLKRVKETYALMSKKKFTHASPTLFNAGMKIQQGASCFLTGCWDDLDSICESWKDISKMSKLGGGIGIHVHDVRSKGAPIRSTNGISDGIIPMLRVMNSVVSYVNQCFVPSTIVYTVHGPKQIQDIGIDDMVLTRDGSYQGVDEVFDRWVENTDLVVIDGKYAHEPVRCTRVHDIFAMRDGDDAPYFHQAGDLSVGDWLAFPIPRNVHPDARVLTPEACYRRGVRFGRGLDATLEHVYMALPTELSKAFLRGIVSTSRIDLDLTVYTQHPGVEAIVRHVCLRLGVLVQRMRTQCGAVCLPKHPNLRDVLAFEVDDTFDFYENNGMLFHRISRIDTCKYTGPVYDLSVRENHNYTVSSGLVHNSGRRKGSMAVYISPHHPDIMEFLELRRPGGDEMMRCRDLFLAMWIPDLFMRRVESDDEWSLFDPSLTPGLDDVWGDDYDELYARLEAEGRAVKTVKAREIWNRILRSHIETGTPYMLYKDACNAKSNQQNIGTIKCSNLCSEIVEFTGPDETSVCTLASVSLPSFVKADGTFDFADLMKVTKVAARNLDRLIDVNVYPIEKARRSNMRHRPVGIGVQGLADVFAMMKLAFDSPEAHALNVKIFAAMYYAAIEQSIDLAAEHGPYDTYSGSPASRGLLQYDLWGVDPHPDFAWSDLKHKLKKHGLRNSLSIAVMPTASTAQVFGNNESIEPFTSVLYTRRTLAGEFVVINRHLVTALVHAEIWTPQLKDAIIAAHGSIQNIPQIPQDIKMLYKTAWDLSQKTVIDQAAERSPYVCQSQSLNIFMSEPTYAKLTSMHFYGWKRGLKTGQYYLRSKPASTAKKITLSPSMASVTTVASDTTECLMCSS